MNKKYTYTERNRVSIELRNEEYELLKKIAQMEYRTIKACAEMVLHSYIHTRKQELSV